MLQRWRHRRRCRNLAQACPQPVLQSYLESCAGLDIGRIDETPLIAADLELTGMESSCDRIIAIGWTLVDGGRIRIGSNRHMLIHPEDQTVGTSAAYHEILDNEVAEGEPLEAGLEELFAAARGRVWIFHHAGLDIAFLKKACARWAGVLPGFIVLDTLRIEYRLRLRREVPVKHGDLQLSQIRSRYGLPRYTAHNALNDAIATAELMLAIAAGMQGDAPLGLSPHLKYF